MCSLGLRRIFQLVQNLGRELVLLRFRLAMNLSVSWHLSPWDFMLDFQMGMHVCFHRYGEHMLVGRSSS